MKKLNIKAPHVRRLATVLVVLIFISFNLIFVFHAKYISQYQGNDDAEVGSFNVTASGTLTESFSTTLQPGDVIDKDIKIVNNSDVAIKYTVTVSTTGNLPLNFSWTEKTGKLGYNGTVTDTLSISWPNAAKDAKYSGRIELITITVVCEQIG